MLKNKIIVAYWAGNTDQDFIKLNGFNCFITKFFSNIEETIELSTINFGLVNSINMARIELQINYY
jgi:threonine synthase